MPKLCFLTTSLSTGGIEMYLLRFLRYLELDKYDITVVVRSFKKGELEEDYQSLGVKIIRQPMGYLHPWRMLKYYRLFRRNDFDVVCDFNANFAGLPIWIGRWAGIGRRIAFYRQGKDHFESSYLKNAFNKVINRLVYQHATHILSNSRAALDYFFPHRTSEDKRFRVIRNGVNIAEYQLQETKSELREKLGLPKDAFIIGHVGRVNPAKNHSTILKVFKKVKQTIPMAHLVLCGRGTSQLKSKLKTWGVEANANMWEYRNDIPRVLHSLDCFLFPSITEGQPNALIEAMVAGTPIVASNIPSIKECMLQKAWEQLADPMDVEALADKVVRVRKQMPNLRPLHQYAKKQFSAEENFKIFKEILLNG